MVGITIGNRPSPKSPEARRKVLNGIKKYAREQGRDSEEIHLVAVTKGFEAELIRSISDEPFRNLGENRVGEALEKRNQLNQVADQFQWHFIGHLQSNKVRKIVGVFDLIHSVDRMSLIEELGKRCGREGVVQPVLLQVNCSGEESKYGANPGDAAELVEEILQRKSIDLRGLMTMAPWTDNESIIHQTFSDCRSLRDDLQDQFDGTFPVLSMGMTNDYRIAIDEGSTMLRLGRALFGERPEP